MPGRLKPHRVATPVMILLIGAATVASAQPPAPASQAQPPSGQMQQVLDRLDRLEQENRELMTELRALRAQLGTSNAPNTAANTAQAPAAAVQAAAAAPAQAPLEDRVAVEEQRTAQLDQEKISTDHKLPLTFTGMLLENTFWNGKGSAGGANPTIAPDLVAEGSAGAGATFRQSVIGAKFDGGQIFWGGKISGSAYADFFGGTGAPLAQFVRLRVASVNADWKNTTVTVALDKPIIAPREPDSLAQVGVSPLTSAGNLWLWQPQVRVEQRFAIGDNAGLRAQMGIYQTAETGVGAVATEYGGSLARSRPGYEGRFEFWAGSEGGRRIEIAPGFHASSTHVLDQSTPSQVFSVDWLVRPFRRLDFTGQFFHGENVGVIGGLQQGVSLTFANYALGIRSVGATGGWGQLKLRITPRLTMNLYGGQEDDRNRDLAAGSIGKNLTYAGNFMYRFGTNILGAFEASETRTTYLGTGLGAGIRLFPHYDLAIAYLF